MIVLEDDVNVLVVLDMEDDCDASGTSSSANSPSSMAGSGSSMAASMSDMDSTSICGLGGGGDLSPEPEGPEPDGPDGEELTELVLVGC